jgi:hypothetical protein
MFAFMSSLILSLVSFSRRASICSISITLRNATRCNRRSSNLINLTQSVPFLTPVVTHLRS